MALSLHLALWWSRVEPAPRSPLPLSPSASTEAGGSVGASPWFRGSPYGAPVPWIWRHVGSTSATHTFLFSKTSTHVPRCYRLARGLRPLLTGEPPTHGRMARFGGPRCEWSAYCAFHRQLGRTSDAPSPPRPPVSVDTFASGSTKNASTASPVWENGLSRPRTPSTTRDPEGPSPFRGLSARRRISSPFAFELLEP